jgi:hypothetical protein
MPEIKPDSAGSDVRWMRLLYDFGYGEEDCRIFNYWQPGHPVTAVICDTERSSSYPVAERSSTSR